MGVTVEVAVGDEFRARSRLQNPAARPPLLKDFKYGFAKLL